MEYIFGTVFRNGTMMENLKIISTSHTDFRGFQQVLREYPDSIITDNFRVVEKYREAEDAGGKTYDWYVIDSHYRVVDKTKPVVEAEARNTANIDYLSMMTGVDLPEETVPEQELVEGPNETETETFVSVARTSSIRAVLERDGRETEVHSAKFDKVMGQYEAGLWTEEMVRNAVCRWITEAEAEEIVGGGTGVAPKPASFSETGR